MFKKILIIGCGLIGSSILRATIKKKISKKIFILEKSKKHINQIKKLRLNCEVLKGSQKQIPKMDMSLRGHLLFRLGCVSASQALVLSSQRDANHF